ncbi:ABC transporter ATP-binding protein [Frigoriglobus tundricola]|uniref:ABC transporter ATP-binding protein n=1 Tax=Frigoriglobus tundricola TaxID=2774151 RepID=UPI001D08DAF6|nr:ABC transporter ATP-binding protein [Frigoriglobus tundricola]
MIRVNGLGKMYRIGLARQQGDGLRHALEAGVRQFGRRLLGRGNPDPKADEFWALKDVSFEVKRGECVGVIGRNGAGKSTLLKVLSRITEPTTGEVGLRGRVGSLLEVGTGFHQELSGRENIFLNGAILGMGRKEIARKFDEIVAFSEVEKFLDTPVKRYSSGMYVRLAFAVAAHLEPDILIVDEVLAVGDSQFQQKCIKRMEGVTREGRTVLVVSHNVSVVRSLCSRALQLEYGKVVGLGGVEEQVGVYLQRMARSVQTDLAARTDREGNGIVRMVRLLVLDRYGQPGGQMYSGDPWSIMIEYQGRAAPEKLRVQLSIWLAGDGTKVFHVDNEMRGSDLGSTLGGGHITCRFPRLNLAPGMYYCNALIGVGGDVADHIYRAADFTVYEGDFYGIGRPAPGVGGAVLIDHEWSIGSVLAGSTQQSENSNGGC